MIYFLDFDRTLFDTPKFVEYLHTRDNTKEILQDIAYDDVVETLVPFLESEAVTFTPGELREFVYFDVHEFLRMTGNESVIVTYGNVLFQRAKIESALFGIPRVSVRYTGSMEKGMFLQSRIERYSGKKLFVDDKSEALESVSTHCPDIEMYEMRRDGSAGDGRWNVINSLNELP